MRNSKEFARELHIDIERLQVFIDRGWISPVILDGSPKFPEVELARATLIADLSGAMGVNDEGVDVVLDLLDQLYGLRFAFGTLIEALELQPQLIRRHVVIDTQSLKALPRRGTRLHH